MLLITSTYFRRMFSKNEKIHTQLRNTYPLIFCQDFGTKLIGIGLNELILLILRLLARFGYDMAIYPIILSANFIILDFYSTAIAAPLTVSIKFEESSK